MAHFKNKEAFVDYQLCSLIPDSNTIWDWIKKITLILSLSIEVYSPSS